MEKQQTKKNFFLLVQICAVLVFFGRAYQFYFFGAPFRALLWDESLLSPVVEGIFNTPWYDYATSETVNASIETFTKICALVLITAAVISLFWTKIPYTRFKKTVLYLAFGILVFVGICLVKDKNYDILQLFEQALQMAAPVTLLVIGHRGSWELPKLEFWLKVAIALTFIPHGLFAMGLFYVPGHFIDMTIQILGVSESNAIQFLFIVGLLDVLASVALFIPNAAKYALWYIIIWGTITALARLAAGFDSDFFLSSLHNHAYLTIYRLPHGLMPLGVLWLYYSRQTIKS